MILTLPQQMPKQKHHLKPPGVKGQGVKDLGLCQAFPLISNDLQLNLVSSGLSFLLCKMKQLDRTSKPPFQLHFSNYDFRGPL